MNRACSFTTLNNQLLQLPPDGCGASKIHNRNKKKRSVSQTGAYSTPNKVISKVHIYSFYHPLSLHPPTHFIHFTHVPLPSYEVPFFVSHPSNKGCTDTVWWQRQVAQKHSPFFSISKRRAMHTSTMGLRCLWHNHCAGTLKWSHWSMICSNLMDKARPCPIFAPCCPIIISRWAPSFQDRGQRVRVPSISSQVICSVVIIVAHQSRWLSHWLVYLSKMAAGTTHR